MSSDIVIVGNLSNIPITEGQLIGRYLFLVLLPLFLLVWTFLVILFWRNRNRQPIKARLPKLALIGQSGFVLWWILIGLQIIFPEHWPCGASEFAVHTAMGLVLDIYFIRVWSLFFAFQLTKSQMDYIASSKMEFRKKVLKETKYINWFLQHTYLIKNRFLFLLVTCLITLQLIPPVLINISDQEYAKMNWEDDCVTTISRLILVIYVGVYLVIFIFFYIRSRKIVDAFYIKTELKIVTVLSLIFVVAWFALPYWETFNRINNVDYPFISTLWVSIGLMAIFLTSTLYPLLKLTKHETDIEEKKMLERLPSQIGLHSFQQFLDSPVGFSSFQDFLATEFSIENLHFWKAATDFSENAKKIAQCEGEDEINEQKNKTHGMAMTILKSFLFPGAPLPINIPSKVLKDLIHRVSKKNIDIPCFERTFTGMDFVASLWLTESLEKAPGKYVEMDKLASDEDPDADMIIDHDFFADAAINIFELMRSDPFMRFQYSPQFNSLCGLHDLQTEVQKVTDSMSMF